MKAFKVRFNNGHFIDTETRQRIIPITGAQYTLTGEDGSFETKDILSEIGESLSIDGIRDEKYKKPCRYKKADCFHV